MRPALLAAVLVLAITPAVRGVAPRPACARTAAKQLVVAASTEVLVYRKRDVGGSVSYFACHLRTRRITVIGEAYEAGDDFGGPGSLSDGRSVTVNGRIVGFTRISCIHTGGCENEARAFDARTGHRTARFHDSGPGGFERIVVTTSGRLAMTFATSSVTVGDHTVHTQVMATGTGRAILLDQGDDLDPDSLAVSGNRIYWMHADQPRSAYLVCGSACARRP